MNIVRSVYKLISIKFNLKIKVACIISIFLFLCCRVVCHTFSKECMNHRPKQPKSEGGCTNTNSSAPSSQLSSHDHTATTPKSTPVFKSDRKSATCSFVAVIVPDRGAEISLLPGSPSTIAEVGIDHKSQRIY